MITPITTKAKQKGPFPKNQEVTMNADGSGGPIKVDENHPEVIAHRKHAEKTNS